MGSYLRLFQMEHKTTEGDNVDPTMYYRYRAKEYYGHIYYVFGYPDKNWNMFKEDGQHGVGIIYTEKRVFVREMWRTWGETIFRASKIKELDGTDAPLSRRFLVNLSGVYQCSFTWGANARFIISPTTYNPYSTSPYDAFAYCDFPNEPKTYYSANYDTIKPPPTHYWDVLEGSVSESLDITSVITLDRRKEDVGIKTYVILSGLEKVRSCWLNNASLSFMELAPLYDPERVEGSVEMPCTLVTKQHLYGLMDTRLDDDAIDKAIGSAHGLVLNTVVNKDLKESELAYIELYLSAHYAWLEEQYRKDTPEWDSCLYRQNCYYKGLDSSEWGRKAKALDKTGTLAKMPCV